LDKPDPLESQGAEKIAVANERETWVQVVDTALKGWCQGDCVIGDQQFVYRFNPQRPLTNDSAEVTQKEADLTESKVKGFAVITQTCDVVRSCIARPFIEIAPLVEVDEQRLHEIQSGKRPQYAYISGIAEYKLVADLDRVMTVEKAVVAEWQRVPGCQNDQDVRTLGQALARKRIRFAFPDDFTQFANKLQKRMQEKHDKKESPEGNALRALREIRVRAEPSWNAPEVNLMFWFIRHEQQSQFEGIGWDQFLKQWLKLIPESGRFQNVEGLVMSLEDMTAKEYVESDHLDLDHLSL
jgi:hypothetical protein